MIKKALSSKKGEEELVQYLNPVVNSEGEAIIDRWLDERGIYMTEGEKKKAIEIGWLAFPFALKKYKEKIDLIERGENIEIYKISEYIPWLVRQKVLEYLNENYKNDL